MCECNKNSVIFFLLLGINLNCLKIKKNNGNCGSLSDS